MLDQQVVRAALKACEKVQNATSLSGDSSSSPFNAYLRYVRRRGAVSQDKNPQHPVWADWRCSVMLLELRAARIVEDRLAAEKTRDADASFDQRVSRAVTEAYVAAQIGELIETLPLKEYTAEIMRSLQRLVSCWSYLYELSKLTNHSILRTF